MRNPCRRLQRPNTSIAFYFLFGLAGAASSAPVPKAPVAIPSLPEKIVEAWRHGGGTYGYLNTNFQRMECRFCEGVGREVTQIPGFYFEAFGSWKAENSDDLPLPESPFGLDLGRRDLEDIAALKSLSRFGKHLRWLIITPGRVTDESIDVISSFEDLECLVLQGPVTDDGLKRLAQMKKLQILCLERSEVTQDGLSHLTTASQLAWLSISLDDKLTEVGVKHLASVERLWTSPWVVDSV